MCLWPCTFQQGVSRKPLRLLHYSLRHPVTTWMPWIHGTFLTNIISVHFTQIFKYDLTLSIQKLHGSLTTCYALLQKASSALQNLGNMALLSACTLSQPTLRGCETSVHFVTRVDLSFLKCFSMQQGCSHSYCSTLCSNSWGGSCPSSQGSHFTIHSRPDSGKSPRGDPILFPLLVVAPWPVSEALSGRRLGTPLPPGLAEKAEWLFSSASRATKSGPAKSNIVACLCPSQHTEHWGYQIQRAPPPWRTISPRLSQHTNWKASFIREHCSCSQKVCLESIILNIQLIVKDFRQNWKVAVLICHFCFLVQTFNLFFI